MTPPNAPRNPHGPHPARDQRELPAAGNLDSSAQLLAQIDRRLGNRLSHLSLNGSRRLEVPPTLVLVAHGSRDPRTLATVRTLVERLRERRPGLPVRLGHIELNEPLLEDTLAAHAPGRAVLVPLLLGRGYHVKYDLPAAAAAAPHLRTRVAAPLGPHPLLVEALYARLVEAGWPARDRVSHRTTDRMADRMTDAVRRSSGVVLAAAGSKDPDGIADTRRTAEQLAERLGVPVLPAYASAAAPTVRGAVRTLAARGRYRVAVASYFTAPGRFAAESAAAAPMWASAPLGVHPAVVRLLLRRYDDAAAALTAPAEATLARVSA